MNYGPRILLNPLSSLFGGGGGSQSTASTSNQQVGAEGNSGPVFGAITIKGNSAKSNSTKTSASNGRANGTGRKGKTDTATATQSPTSTNGSGGGQTSASGAGNLSISVVSGDSVAEQHNATLAAGSIDAQNQLATTSIAAQNFLASKTLDVATGIAAASFGFAQQAQRQVSENASDVLQAGQNFGALYDGANPQDLVQPTGGGDNTKVLLWVGIGIGVLALLRD